MPPHIQPICVNTWITITLLNMNSAWLSTNWSLIVIEVKSSINCDFDLRSYHPELLAISSNQYIWSNKGVSWSVDFCEGLSCVSCSWLLRDQSSLLNSEIRHLKWHIRWWTRLNEVKWFHKIGHSDPPHSITVKRPEILSMVGKRERHSLPQIKIIYTVPLLLFICLDCLGVSCAV